MVIDIQVRMFSCNKQPSIGNLEFLHHRKNVAFSFHGREVAAAIKDYAFRVPDSQYLMGYILCVNEASVEHRTRSGGPFVHLWSRHATCRSEERALGL